MSSDSVLLSVIVMCGLYIAGYLLGHGMQHGKLSCMKRFASKIKKAKEKRVGKG